MPAAVCCSRIGRYDDCGSRIADCGFEGPEPVAPIRNPQSTIRNSMTLGLIIFGVTYLFIAVQRLPFLRLNRPAASLLGAVAMVVCGVLPLRDAYAAIDLDVLVFLLGLMLIVGYLEVGKCFEWAAEWILRRARTPVRLLLGVVVGGGLLSALFVNDTICLVVTPVLLAALGPLRLKPNPYLIALAMGANVGSVVSVTGNPQNMLGGSGAAPRSAGSLPTCCRRAVAVSRSPTATCGGRIAPSCASRSASVSRPSR